MNLKEKMEYIIKNMKANREELSKHIGVSEATIKRVIGTLPVDNDYEFSKSTIDKIDKFYNDVLIINESKTNLIECVKVTQSDKIKMEKELKKASKKIQMYMDSNRFLRKNLREENREEYISENLLNEILKKVPQIKVDITSNDNYIKDEPCSVVAQLSDLHLGQLVNTRSNKFNYDIARFRLGKYFDNIKLIAKNNKTNNIYVIFSGDLFNLDHRMDMLLTSEGTRAESLIKGFDIISECIHSLLVDGYNIKIAGATGNESRMKGHEYMSNIDHLAKDSLDYILFQMLKRFFELNKNIKFINDCEYIIDAIQIEDLYLSFTHGHQFGKNISSESIINFKQIVYESKGKMPDYICFGHIHESLITNNFARSGSLVGGNGYSENGLLISGSKASQNAYVVRGKEIFPTIIILN